MKTQNATTRRATEYDVKLIRSLSDADIDSIRGKCRELTELHQKHGTVPSLLRWLEINLFKEQSRRKAGAQAEPFCMELSPEIFAEDPVGLGQNLVACMLLMRSLTSDRQSGFVGEILHDLCIVAKTRLANYSDLISRM